MADINEANDEPGKIICNYCRKSVVKKAVKCTNCEKSYHNSCSERTVCCGNKIVTKSDVQEVKTCQEVLLSTEEINNILTTNEKVTNLNKLLIEENESLKQDIIKYKDIINKLTYEKDTPQKERNSKEKTNIHDIIKTELDNRLSLIVEELKMVNIKVNKLESINKINLEDITEIQKNNKETSNKNPNKTVQTKTGCDNKQMAFKDKLHETNLLELESKQKQIMNKVINLNVNHTPNEPIQQVNIKSTITQANMNEYTKEDTQEYQLVSYKKKKNGRGEGEQSTLLKAAPKTNWIWLGDCEEESTVENIKKYVEDIYPNKNIICYDLKSKRRRKCFKIGSLDATMEELLNPKRWPEGVSLRPFRAKPKIEGTI